MTPEEYSELYKKHNMTPARGAFVVPTVDGGYCGCVVGVRRAEHFGSPKAAHEILRSQDTCTAIADAINELDVSLSFRTGLQSGFDNLIAFPPHYENDADYKAGYDEGRAAYTAMTPRWHYHLHKTA